MPTLGFSELLLIFMLLVLVFGGSRLPALGEGLGRTVRNFKRSLSSDDKIQVKDGKAPDNPQVPAEKAEPASGDNPTKLEATDAEIIEKP